MLEKWTGEVIGTAHMYGIQLSEIAEEMGISTTMLSMYLHGKRRSKTAEERIKTALVTLIEKKNPSEPDYE